MCVVSSLQELDELLQVWLQVQAKGEQAVLATVVDVSGSAYRRPGARMLMTSDGQRFGSISGGCLEADVVEQAWPLTESRRAAVCKYDTTRQEDALFGSGLGCNGIVRVLLERLGTGESDEWIHFFLRLQNERAAGVVVTIIDSPKGSNFQVGGRFMMAVNQTLTAGVHDEAVIAAMREAALDVLDEKKSRLLRCKTELGIIEAFVEYIAPPLSLVIFGGGQDAVPLVHFAKELGWHVTIVDWREALANSERFPNADDIVVVRPEESTSRLQLGDNSLAVLMNHNYLADMAILEKLLELDMPYIGVLGPSSRTQRMLDELGVSAPPSNLHFPVGLNIGADTPAAIALAICAEIQAVVSGRNASMLREHHGPIHARPAEPIHKDATKLLSEVPA